MKISKSKNSLSSKTGITLIALVITIIVLLILAGVSISLVVGNNGVLTQASNSVVKNREASAKEEVVLAVASCESDYWTDWAKNSSADISTYFSLGRLQGYAPGVQSVTTPSATDGSFQVTYRKEGVDYTFNVDANRNVTLATSETGTSTGGTGTGGSSTEGGTGGNSSVTTYTVTFYANSGDTTAYETKTVNSGETIGNSNMPTNPTKTGYTFARWKLSNNNEFTASTEISADISVYADWTADPTAGFGTANPDYISRFGYKVTSGYTGYTAYDEGDVWRLFYADSNFVYLISDSIGKKALNSLSGFGTSTISTLAQNLNPKYTATGNWELKTDETNINNNIKGVAALLDTSEWTAYKTEDAVWAIGAPTVEMFIASYNATHTDAMHTADSEVKSQQLNSQVASYTATGYQVKIGTGDYANSVYGLGFKSDLDKAIYCRSADWWWLASPGAAGSNNAMVANNNMSGGLCGSWYSTNYTIRPLVAVPLSKIGTGTGKITIGASYD